MYQLVLGLPPIMLNGSMTRGLTLEPIRKDASGPTWCPIKSRPLVCIPCRVHWRPKECSVHGEHIFIVIMDICITGLALFINAVILMMTCLNFVSLAKWPPLVMVVP
jgi:hypothetical protein